MRRVTDPDPPLLGFDLMSEIDTYPIELSDQCLDLIRSPAALTDFECFTAAQTFDLVCSHGRSPQTVSLWCIGQLDRYQQRKIWAKMPHFGALSHQQKPPRANRLKLGAGTC